MFEYYIRFLLGYLSGSLFWLVVVNPYRRYYDFTFGYYWPQVVFSLAVCLIFMGSLSARATSALFIPNMIGGATQNYIVMLLLTALVTNPLANIGFNSVESVRVIGCSLTLAFDRLSEHAKLVVSPILAILNDNNQTDLDTIRQDLVRIQSFVGQFKHSVQQIGVPQQAWNQAPASPTNPPPEMVFKKGDATTTTASNMGVQLDWDLENFGVKANIDMERLRSLAKSGKLQGMLGHDLSNGLNLTDILYTSCMRIFESAKRECSNAVDDLYASCKDSIGPYFATIWCMPFTASLDQFCPMIMDQLVDEKSVCKQIKVVQEVKLSNNRTVDINEAFEELNKQIARLNQHILVDEISPFASKGEATRRLQIHLTFNERTRQVFQTTKSVIEFISDKYKMRRLFIDILLFAYDLYTTYTFLLILLRAWQYRVTYLRNIKFDNFYITDDFKQLDASMRQDNGAGGSVLPLTRDEARRYISTFTCRRRTGEERQVQQLAFTIAAIFLAFSLSLLFLDGVLRLLLDSIHDHSLLRFKELGHHELNVHVRGEGVISHLVRQLTSRLRTVYDLNHYTSTRRCLPESRRTTRRFYLQFICLVGLYFLIDQVSIYAMRLRHVTCAAFYPDKQRQRVEFLHKLIQFKRNRLRANRLASIEADNLDELADHNSNKSSQSKIKSGNDK